MRRPMLIGVLVVLAFVVSLQLCTPHNGVEVTQSSSIPSDGSDKRDLFTIEAMPVSELPSDLLEISGYREGEQFILNDQYYTAEELLQYFAEKPNAFFGDGVLYNSNSKRALEFDRRLYEFCKDRDIDMYSTRALGAPSERTARHVVKSSSGER